MLRKLILGVCTFLLTFEGGTAEAEMNKIKIAEGFGIGFLPMYVMHDRKLVEKHAKFEHLDQLKVEWVRISGGTLMNDGLLSGSLQVASGGITPLIVAWDKTAKSSAEIKGLSVFSSSPMYLLSRNPAVKSINDLSSKDKIAMPAAKLAPQFILLQMAAERRFGIGKHTSFDRLTVSMSHPDATAAMLSNVSEVNGHFSTPPFMFREMADPSIRVVLDSTDLLGGPGVFGVMWTTTRFYQENPKIYRAIVGALDEAISIIEKDKVAAAQSYLRVFKSKETVDEIVAILNKPELGFSKSPKGISKYVDFMYRTGSIKKKPNSWQEMFLPNNANISGD